MPPGRKKGEKRPFRKRRGKRGVSTAARNHPKWGVGGEPQRGEKGGCQGEPQPQKGGFDEKGWTIVDLAQNLRAVDCSKKLQLRGSHENGSPREKRRRTASCGKVKRSSVDPQGEKASGLRREGQK